MKILHIITSMDPKRGGVSQAVRNIVRDNKFSYHEVVCMDSDSEDYGTADSFVIHKVGPGKTSYQYNPQFKKWLSDHLADYTHAIVHGIWQYHHFASYQVYKSLNKDTRPYLTIMPHGMLDPYFQKASGRKIKALRNNIIWSLTEKRGVNTADAILFTCEEELLLARKTFAGYKPKKELNVGLGVTPPPAEQQQMHTAFRQKAAIEGPYWLFLSRLHPKKGINLLIEAYKDLLKENSAIPSLVIAGPLDDEYSLQMKDLAAGNPKIVFTGMISGDTKWGAFYGTDAFILPSFQENFGIAIVEAMACRKPVAITRNINIWREIFNGQGGLLIEEQTPVAIKSVLKMLYEMPVKELEKKGTKAYEAYRENFDLDECAKKIILMLKGL